MTRPWLSSAIVAAALSAAVTGDPGGATARFTVTFPRAGRYPFHCQYHQSAGMTGVFVVS